LLRTDAGSGRDALSRLLRLRGGDPARQRAAGGRARARASQPPGDAPALPVGCYGLAVGLRSADVARPTLVQRALRWLLRGQLALPGVLFARHSRRPRECTRACRDPAGRRPRRGEAAIRDVDHVDVFLLVAVPRDLVRQRAGGDAVLPPSLFPAAV